MTNTIITCEFSNVSTYVDGINAGRCVTVEDAAIEYADEMYSYISDASKEANGCRYRFDHTGMTFAQLEAECDYWSAQAQIAIDEERAIADQVVKEFKALVQQTIELGAGDEATALRWLTQDQEFYSGQCVEHWVYNQGVLFTDYGKALVNQLLDIVQFNRVNAGVDVPLFSAMAA
jgi:hypothetical protein